MVPVVAQRNKELLKSIQEELEELTRSVDKLARENQRAITKDGEEKPTGEKPEEAPAIEAGA